MNTLRTPVFAAAATVAAALSSVSQAAVPPVDPIGKAAQVTCGISNSGTKVLAVHADKIIFVLTGFLQATLPGDQPVLDKVPRNDELDIKVLDNPRTVADLKGKVLSFLGALDTPANRQAVRIVDVDYAMVCPAAHPL